MGGIYATKQKPCPICGRIDWCTFLPGKSAITQEDGLYICRKCQSTWDVISPVDGMIYHFVGITSNGDGMYVNLEVQDLKNAEWKQNKMNNKPSIPAIPVMKAKHEIPPILPLENKSLGGIYKSFLMKLQLNSFHKKYLKEEGWEDALIKKSMFRSIPSGKDKERIAYELIKEFGSLKGVPGFYLSKNRYTFAGSAGILMPLYDVESQIFRLRIRKDKPEIDNNGKEKNKYGNFSSCIMEEKDGVIQNVYLEGCQAGPQIGVYKQVVKSKELFFITEGEKKSIVANEILKALIVNLTGVSYCDFITRPNGTEVSILSYLIQNEYQVPVIAFDADKRWNKKVLQCEENLVMLLKQHFPKVAIADWNPGFGKGLDDILLTGIRPNIRFV